jgi:hypothetical protein
MVARFSTNAISAGDYRWLVEQMRELDKEVFNQMRRDFRSGIRPFSRKLSGNIPSKLPISGTLPNARYARQSLDQRAPWVWKKPTVSIDVGSRTRARVGARSTEPVVRIRFNDRRPYSLFSILERRNGGKLPDIANRFSNYGDRGRWVIPQFYRDQDQMIQIAKKILVSYTQKFNRLIARRFS